MIHATPSRPRTFGCLDWFDGGGDTPLERTSETARIYDCFRCAPLGAEEQGWVI